MPIGDQAGEAVKAVTSSMQSVPLAIALLVVNIGFLAFAAYVLGEVANNAAERNKNQTELIASLVKDIKECNKPVPRG